MYTIYLTRRYVSEPLQKHAHKEQRLYLVINYFGELFLSSTCMK